MEGVGGPVVPPLVVRVPFPVNVNVIFPVAPIPPVAVNVGKEPVAPAKLAVPPVTVADPVTLPARIEADAVRVPVMVPVVPLVSVMVYGPEKVVAESVPL